MKSFFNYIYYAYKRNNWMLDFSRLWENYGDVNIKKPIFLLSTHGGGLTLISRMLRRNKRVVSVSGNCKYWAGADEMHVVLGPILPFEFSGIKHHVPDHPKFKNHTSWLYATDELISHYRLTEEDVTPELAETFRKVIRWLIHRHAVDKNNVRFTDKSQSYTVKVSFINEILKDTDPKFILVTRNPYAVCYRAPEKAGGLQRIKDKFSFKELLEFASQHWANSMKYALEDKPRVDNFLTVRFEDILQSPEEKMREICEFAELEFDEDMLPQPHHKIPFGSRFRDRWYPLRPDVNQKYLDDIDQEHIEIIDKYCGQYAQQFNYQKPHS